MIRLVIRGTLFLALAAGASHVTLVAAQDNDVSSYIDSNYGSAPGVADAARVFASSLAALWDQTAVTQKYDRQLTIMAGASELCLRAHLSLVGVDDADGAIDDLKRRVAATPQRYAGYVFSEQLASQNPVDDTITPRQACKLVGAPITLPVPQPGP